MSTVPVVVDPGWDLRQTLDGLDHAALLTYPDGTVRFEHRCDRGDRGVIVCSPALQLGHGHTVLPSTHDGPTITPSVLCSDCGTHGWIRDGRWHAA